MSHTSPSQVFGYFLGNPTCACFHLENFLLFYTLNPLTTDDAFWCRLTLATCYQLAQSVLKIGSARAERVGQGEVCAPSG